MQAVNARSRHSLVFAASDGSKPIITGALMESTIWTQAATANSYCWIRNLKIVGKCGELRVDIFSHPMSIVRKSLKIFHLRSTGIVLSPDTDVLVKMMWAKYWRVPSQIIEVIHDDSHKEIQHLPTHNNDDFPGYLQRTSYTITWLTISILTRSLSKYSSNVFLSNRFSMWCTCVRPNTGSFKQEQMTVRSSIPLQLASNILHVETSDIATPLIT